MAAFRTCPTSRSADGQVGSGFWELRFPTQRFTSQCCPSQWSPYAPVTSSTHRPALKKWARFPSCKPGPSTPLQVGKWHSENISCLVFILVGQVCGHWEVAARCLRSPKKLVCPRDKQFTLTWLQRTTVGRRGISLKEATKSYMLVKPLTNAEILCVRQARRLETKERKVKTYFLGGKKVLFKVQNQPKLEEAGYRRKRSVSIRQRKSYTCKTSEKIKPWHDTWLFLVLCGSV